MNRTAAVRLGVLLCVPAITVAACNREPAPPAAETEVTENTGTQARPDAWITTSVQARLYGDDAVRGGNVDVDTNGGVVTLRGTVESEQAKQQAVTVARAVEGVTRVDDQMTVQPAQARNEREPGDTVATTGTAAEAGSPGWITTKIQAQYFLNPEVKPWNIDVTTNSGGVVELRGEVDAAADKAEAVRIARETEGVRRVEDNLRIRGEAPAANTTTGVTDLDTSDPWLTTKVQSKFFLDGDVKGRDIDVTTQNGVVTLRGTVDSAAERRRAVAIANNTEGVREVRDELRMEAETTARTDDTAARTTTGTRAAAGIDDAWVTTKVQSMYFLDPDIKGHEINVDTRNGVVTLAGTVESQAAKTEAEQIARETDGVTRVVNRLTVAPAQVQ